MSEQFGPYQLLELLGEGGQGQVHLAYDTVRKRQVALKRLPLEWTGDEHFVQRFLNESRIAYSLRHHPHIVSINDFGEIDGRLYLDMRLISGGSLAVRLAADGPLPPRLVVVILSQVSSALAAAHGQNLVHRDVKPGNVLLSAGRDKDEPYCYLADFGLAQDDTGAALHLTATEHPAGTLLYMAPERFDPDAGHGDRRVDIYALGCMLYELLTGLRPFIRRTRDDLIRAHRDAPRPVPSDRHPDVPRTLDAVVARAMHVDPDCRYADVAEFASEVRAAVTGGAAPDRGVDERELGRGQEPVGPPLSRRKAVLAGVAIVAVTGVLATGAVWFSQPGPPGSAPSRDAVLANVQVGDTPYGVAVTPDGKYAYVTNYRSDSVSVLDAAANTVVRTIQVGARPSEVVAAPDGKYVFVADTGSNLVSMIDTSAQAPRATIPVGDMPGALAVDPSALHLFVANPRSNTVSVLAIDNNSLSVTATVPVGQLPNSITVSPDGNRVYVANELSNTVSVINVSTGRVSATVPVDNSPTGVALSPDGALLYVLTRPSTSDQLCVVDTGTNRVRSRLPVNGYHKGIALAPAGNRIYLTDYYRSQVTVLDPTTGDVTSTVPVGQRPLAVTASLDGQRVFVANATSNSVTVIDTSP